MKQNKQTRVGQNKQKKSSRRKSTRNTYRYRDIQVPKLTTPIKT